MRKMLTMRPLMAATEAKARYDEVIITALRAAKNELDAAGAVRRIRTPAQDAVDEALKMMGA